MHNTYTPIPAIPENQPAHTINSNALKASYWQTAKNRV